MKMQVKQDSRFRCGITSFGLSAGAIVNVRQKDEESRKVLLDFGGRMMDWFSDSTLSLFEEVRPDDDGISELDLIGGEA